MILTLTTLILDKTVLCAYLNSISQGGVIPFCPIGKSYVSRSQWPNDDSAKCVRERILGAQSKFMTGHYNEWIEKLWQLPNATAIINAEIKIASISLLLKDPFRSIIDSRFQVINYMNWIKLFSISLKLNNLFFFGKYCETVVKFPILSFNRILLETFLF